MLSSRTPGVVMRLAWNDIIQTSREKGPDGRRYSIAAELRRLLILTGRGVILAVLIRRAAPSFRKPSTVCTVERGAYTEPHVAPIPTGLMLMSITVTGMYRWYEQAEVCFAFLEDFEAGSDYSALSGCRWFTRGWTLQELLAPRAFQFYDKHCTIFGSRHDLAQQLESITGIPVSILRNERSITEASTAQRMFWASKRQTTRTEDMAYCLLGIFNVNLPLLYGEGGQKAFARLQRQILMQPRDDTIYFWHSEESKLRGMLAESPSEFSRSSRIVCNRLHDLYEGSRRPTFTDHAVELTISPLDDIFAWLVPSATVTRRVHMACATQGQIGFTKRLAIVLRRPERHGQFWAREGIEIEEGSRAWWTTGDTKSQIFGFFYPGSPTTRVKVALHVSTDRMLPSRDKFETIGEVLPTIAVLVFVEAIRFVLLDVALYSTPPDTIDDPHKFVGTVVHYWIALTCFWLSAPHSASAALELLFLLFVRDWDSYGKPLAAVIGLVGVGQVVKSIRSAVA